MSLTIPSIPTKCFASSIMNMAKEWNTFAIVWCGMVHQVDFSSLLSLHLFYLWWVFNTLLSLIVKTYTIISIKLKMFLVKWILDNKVTIENALL